MAEQLKNTIQFVNLGPGASVVLPHGLNQNLAKRPLAPDVIFIPNPALSITDSNEISITVLNSGSETLSGSILVESWHTIERAFGDDDNKDLPVKPYVVVSTEGNGEPPTPPWPVPQIEMVIYARMTGNDTSGKGTLALPYRTVQRAAQDIPLIPPRGTTWIIDDSGEGGVLFEEVFPDDYTFPAWVTSFMYTTDISNPYFFYGTQIQIRAIPRLVAAIPLADAVINVSDVLSVRTNPRSGTLTIILNAARPSWTAGPSIKGKLAIGSGNSLEHCEIGEVTPTTIELAETVLPTFPIQIMEPSAHLTGQDTQSGFGALNVFNCGSISFNGQDIDSIGGNYGLNVSRAGSFRAQLCKLYGPAIDGQDVRIVRNWINTFCFVSGSAVFINGLLDQCFFYSPVAAVLQASCPQFINMIIDGCDPIEVTMDSLGIGDLVPAATPRMEVRSSVVRNGTGHGLSFHGVAGVLSNVDLSANALNGVNVDQGGGYLSLEGTLGVGTTGDTNGGVGIRVTDGLTVKANAASSFPFITGTGDSFTFVAGAPFPGPPGTVTLTDAAAPFTAAMVGQPIKIDGATSPGNNGLFIVDSFIDASNITYLNNAGVTEVFAGTWTTGLPLTGTTPGTDDMHVGDGAVRSWDDFNTGASGRPALNELDYFSAAGVGGTFSDDAAAPAYITGTGSRLYQAP